MTLEDTTALMMSENYQDRFRAELYQLQIRLERLNKLLSKYISNSLEFTPKCTYDELHTQYIHMNDYYKDLLHRAQVEGITL